jgi:hypothetical protein
MKYITRSLLLTLTIILICVTAASCAKNCNGTHDDKNGDEKCDVCGVSLGSYTECEEHTDNDNDARCDKCNQSLINPDDDTVEDEIS